MIGGLSFEEVTSDEIDDILPKTEYTYARTASYSPKFLRKKRYRSPNMSRRRVRGAFSSFISDDEEEFEEADINRTETVTTNERVVISEQQMSELSSTSFTSSDDINIQERGRNRGRSMVFTSTPHNEHHISTHDHYYDGMLLRSGSHIKGKERYKNLRRSEGDVMLSSNTELDTNLVGRRRSNRHNTTTTVVTTTTITTEEEEEIARIAAAKKMLMIDEDSPERKLRLDESQTEKGILNKDEFTLKHLNGLDFDEDLSDVDIADSSFDALEVKTTHKTQNRWSFLSFMTSLFSVLTTTVSSAATSISNIQASINSAAYSMFETSGGLFEAATWAATAPVILPARWILRTLTSCCVWLVKKSSSLLVYEVEMKQRKRRSCWCCLLPLLLLLPFLLLGGYYSKPVYEAYLSQSQSAITDSWRSIYLSMRHYAPIYEHPHGIPRNVEIKGSNPGGTTTEIDLNKLMQDLQAYIDEAVKANRLAAPEPPKLDTQSLMMDVKKYVDETVEASTPNTQNIDLDKFMQEIKLYVDESFKAYVPEIPNIDTSALMLQVQEYIEKTIKANTPEPQAAPEVDIDALLLKINEQIQNSIKANLPPKVDKEALMLELKEYIETSVESATPTTDSEALLNQAREDIEKIVIAAIAEHAPKPTSVDISEIISQVKDYVGKMIESSSSAGPDVNIEELQQQMQISIKKTVENELAAFKEDVPEVITEDQVKAIVAAILHPQVDNVKTNLDENLSSFQTLLSSDLTSLENKLTGVRQEVEESKKAHQIMLEHLQQTKQQFDESTADQKQELQDKVVVLENKLASLQTKLDDLNIQNETLTTMVAKCCNKSLTIEDVRQEVLAILSRAGSNDEYRHHLTGLISYMSDQFIERSELDRRLTTVSDEIMENIRGLLANVQSNGGQVTEGNIKSIIEAALTKFSADKTGVPDFALESAGGSIVSVRCSKTYYKKTAQVSIFGIPLWYTSNSPRTVIQPDVHPGECWAFEGTSGFLVIQLSHPVEPTGFTLEHIPRSLSPKGKIDSAPKDFAVFGLMFESDTQGTNLGNYTYEESGKPIQSFDVQNIQKTKFKHVELRILNNHGNPDYTCIYRFRVHGIL